MTQRKLHFSQIIALATLFGSGVVYSSVELSPHFSDNAVLQRDQPVPVWGWSAPGESVSISLGDETQTRTASADGSWRVEFAARKARETNALTVTAGEDKKSVNNLVFGDLWLCGGQSNMEWVLRDSLRGAEEIKNSNYPLIRHFKVPKSWSEQPEKQLAGGSWVAATDGQAGDFSAIGYFFAKNLYQKTDIPIGLIGSNWGGSNIETWMNPETLGEPAEKSIARISKIKAAFEKEKAQVKQYLTRWPEAQNTDAAVADWSAAKLATADWQALKAPLLWEQQNLQNVDGVVWYRKSIQLTAEQASQNAILGLARIDDSDKTWVNGELVGETDGYNIVRRYEINAKALKPGTNTIAIRVEDTGGGGGIYSNDELLYLEFADGSKQSLAGEWLVKPDRVKVSNKSDMNQVPTALYNKMIVPLFPQPIKGVIWYQGESNAGTVAQAEKYKQQFPALINLWRKSWNSPDLPFYWVQLASFNSKNDTAEGSPWAIVREAQTQTLNLKHTGQAITLDVGNSDDIHPKDKLTVGNRLAAIALTNDYGIPTHNRGPILVSASMKKNKIVAQFSADASLATEKGKTVYGFDIVDSNGKIHSVTGKIKRKTIVFKLPDADIKPTQLRYAWKDDPQTANLQDKKGLPAEPGRVDIQ